MNESQRNQLLFRFERECPLSSAEQIELLEQIRNQPELLHELVDRRSIDGMLQLFATDEIDDERFVVDCVSRMTKTAGPDDAGPTVTTTESLAIQQVPVAVVELPDRSSQRRNPNRSRGYLWLAVAASTLVLLGAWISRPPIERVNSDSVVSDSNRPLSQFPITKPVPLATLESPIEPSSNGSPEAQLESNADALLANANEGNNNEIGEHPGIHNRDELDVDVELTPELDASHGLIVDGGSVASEKEQPNPEHWVAAVKNGKNAVWNRDFSGERVGIGKQRLVEGSASIKFDNGILIRLLAPVEFEIKSDRSFFITKGNVVTEIPRTISELMIATPHSVLQNPVNSRVQLIVDPIVGTEALVTRGNIRLGSGRFDNYDDQTVLSKNGLSQILIRPAIEQPWTPAVTMARGKNEFVGRIGDGNESIVFRSPVVFANVIERIGEQASVNKMGADFPENWHQLARAANALTDDFDGRQFQSLVGKFLGNQDIQNPRNKLGDDSGNRTTNFQGSLSINGVQKQFDSFEEYEKARRQMLSGDSMPGRLDSEGQSGVNRFHDELNLNGRPLKFSSPDVFHQLRKQMDR